METVEKSRNLIIVEEFEAENEILTKQLLAITEKLKENKSIIKALRKGIK